MKACLKSFFCPGCFAVVWLIGFSLRGTLCGGQETNRYLRYIGDQPVGGDFYTFFSDGCQGVAADKSNWFFAVHPNIVWKVPFTQPLNVYDAPPSVTSVAIPGAQGSGDLSQLNGYLFVPACGLGTAVLRCSDLSLVTIHPGSCGLSVVFPKIASDGFAYIYSLDTINELDGAHVPRYRFSWEELVNFNSLSSLTRVNDMVLQDWQLPPSACAGGTPPHTQGGKFSPDGRMFYLFFGGNCDDCGNPDACRHGIHAFQMDDTGTNANLIRSSVSSDPNSLFYCEFNEADSCGQEPEALAIVDLDDGRADTISGPIRGQLHVIIVQNCGHNLTEGNIIFKHYTNRLYVNSQSPSGNGTVTQPFQTVGQATGFVNGKSWTTGLELRIAPGLYPESVQLTKPMIVSTMGSGTVTIGR